MRSLQACGEDLDSESWSGNSQLRGLGDVTGVAAVDTCSSWRRVVIVVLANELHVPQQRSSLR